MKPIRGRFLGSRTFGHQHAERPVLALMLLGTVMSSGCLSDKSVVNLPPDRLDAGPLASMGPGGCKWVASSEGSCTLTDVSCPAGCPTSWMQANSAGSCPAAGASLKTESCEGFYRWSSFTATDTLVAACYYDVSTGELAGIDSQTQLPCGANRYQFGTIPSLCHQDAGVEIQRITCSAAGSGGLTDGGISHSCSDAAPCLGGG